jgi:long-chain acyl-CoA synthetase
VQTFADVLRHADAHHASAVAFVDGDTRLTYGELAERARRLINAVIGRGLRPGARVAILAENSYQYGEIFLSLPAAGFVVVPINIRHHPQEIAAALEDAAPQLLFADEVGHVAMVGVHSEVPIVRLGTDYEALLAASGAAPIEAGVDRDSPAAVFFTGGTTGRSKGVVLTHRNCLAVAAAMLVTMRVDADDRWLINGPMFHASGSFGLLGCTWAGATQIVLPRFEVGAAMQTIARERVTVMFGVPIMLARMITLLEQTPLDVSSLRFIGHGGAPMSAEELRRLHDAFPLAELAAMYGATETAGMCAAYTHHERQVGKPAARSCGRPVFGTEFAVVDDQGRALPANTVGEVVVRGDNIMNCYLGRPEETAEALRGGWYHTQDLGYLDRGCLYLVDRKRDMIITGGENVYSLEVEDVLYRYPGVQEAAVIGIPDAEWGEAVVAVVVGGDDLDPEELRAFCRTGLARYKVPKHVFARQDPLPRTPAGKLQKTKLVAEYSATAS